MNLRSVPLVVLLVGLSLVGAAPVASAASLVVDGADPSCTDIGGNPFCKTASTNPG